MWNVGHPLRTDPRGANVPGRADGGPIIRFVLLGGWLMVLLTSAPRAGAEMAVWAKASLSHDRAYVQETVLYTVHVYSAGNLRRIEVIRPRSDRVAIEQLDGPHTRIETIRGQAYILNEFRYALTPLASGTIAVNPTQLTVVPRAEDPPWRLGIRPLGPGRPMSEDPLQEPLDLHTGPVYLVVLPPFRDVKPWLPLRSLAITSQWSETAVERAGEPLRLTLTLTAAGTAGARIPSLAPLLRPADFNVYRGEVRTAWSIDENGGEFVGRRSEAYTLIPLREGRLTVPVLRVRWWDAVRNRRATSEVPAQTVVVGMGASALPVKDTQPVARQRRPTHLSLGPILFYYFLPLGGGLLLALLIGWRVSGARADASRLRRFWGRGAMARWLGGAWQTAPGAPSGGAMGNGPAYFQRGCRGIQRQETAGGRRRMRSWCSSSVLPLGISVNWLRWRVASQTDPIEINRLLRRFAAEHLGMDANASLWAIAERLAAEPLRLDGRSLARLFQRLDDGLYGRREIRLDRWKRDLRRCLRPSLLGRAARPRDRHQRGLPVLNP